MRYVTGEYYHVYNRGVDKRTVFRRDPDYQRFLFILKQFNSFGRSENTSRDIRLSERDRISRGESLVEVADYCLIPNHYHLILRQLVDGGISEFTRKIGIGYTNYFNCKYDRSGVLFQGRTKNKHVDSDKYLQYLVEYVYANPIDLIEPGWKERGIKNKSKVVQFLQEYRWSSAKDLSWFDTLA